MTFLWSIWGKKVIRTAVQAAVAAVGASQLASWGVPVDPLALSAALYTGLEGLRNWLKVKRGVRFL